MVMMMVVVAMAIDGGGGGPLFYVAFERTRSCERIDLIWFGPV